MWRAKLWRAQRRRLGLRQGDPGQRARDDARGRLLRRRRGRGRRAGILRRRQGAVRGDPTGRDQRQRQHGKRAGEHLALRRPERPHHRLPDEGVEARDDISGRARGGPAQAVAAALPCQFAVAQRAERERAQRRPRDVLPQRRADDARRGAVP